jgi:hypothetical protein
MQQRQKLRPGQIRKPLEIIKSCDVNNVRPLTWSWDNFNPTHHTRIPFLSKKEKNQLKHIAVKSRRTLVDITLYLVYKTFQEDDVRAVVRRPFTPATVGSHKHTRSIWISHAVFRKLQDIAFKLGVTSPHIQASSAASAARLIGLCLDYQLSKQSTKHWITFFSKGEDLLERTLYEIKRFLKNPPHSARNR